MELHYPQCIACDFIMYILSLLCVLYSVVSVSYFNYLMMASETPRIYAMFGCKFTPGFEKCYHSFAKDVIHTNIWLKKCRKLGGGGRMHKTICGTLANSCCRNWTYGTLAQIMQCTELSPLRFAILKVP